MYANDKHIYCTTASHTYRHFFVVSKGEWNTLVAYEECIACTAVGQKIPLGLEQL